MHLGNGAITAECAVLAFGAAAGGLALCARAAFREGIGREKLVLAGTAACLTLAAQAINVPVAAEFSGHLVGGVLLAWLLGPGLGAWTMAAVLLVQAAAWGDGGLAALGANVLNMAVVPASLVMLLRWQFVGRESKVDVAVMSGIAVFLAAVLIVGETALFRGDAELAGWGGFAIRMTASHLWIGLLEAGASYGILLAIDALSARARVSRPALLGIAGAILAAAILLPISSGLPDGYEAAAEASGMGWLVE
jgi:cobalt/nickel transport system permease protein